MQIYIISNQIDIWYIGFKLSKQGEVFTLMVRWKQTHWNMLAHRMTIKATVFSLGLIIACLLLCFFSFITIWQTTCTCFILTVLKVKKQKNNKKKNKNCAFLKFRTENGVLPEQRFVGLHTLSVMLGVRKHCQEQV